MGRKCKCVNTHLLEDGVALRGVSLDGGVVTTDGGDETLGLVGERAELALLVEEDLLDDVRSAARGGRDGVLGVELRDDLIGSQVRVPGLCEVSVHLSLRRREFHGHGGRSEGASRSRRGIRDDLAPEHHTKRHGMPASVCVCFYRDTD